MRVIPWETMDWPVDLDSLWPQGGSLVLEIGYGNGDFLVHLARQDASRGVIRNYLGIEISWACTQRLLARVKRHGIDSIRMMEGDAAYILEHVLPADSIAEAFINFSDPWPKPRHHRRRVIQHEFLKTLSSRLQPGAGLTIATDHPEYADWIEDILCSQPYFQNMLPTPRIDSIPGRIPTRYEAKALEAGLPINYFLWRKPEDAAPSPSTPRRKVKTMPNMRFKGTVLPKTVALEDHVQLSDEHDGEPVHIKYLGAYQNPRDASWLIEALVQEADFSQHCAFLLAPRPDGHWVLKLSSVGSPRPTWGVKLALGSFGLRILEAQPDLELVGNSTGVEAGVHSGPKRELT